MEIKFRGKSFDNNWVYGYYQEVDAEGKIFSYIFWQGHPTPVIKESVGQLWKPSLGVELYTGDLFTAICSLSGSDVKRERLCKVNFEGKGFSVSIWHKKEWWAYSSIDFTSVKVVGNTTDNPDLLWW